MTGRTMGLRYTGNILDTVPRVRVDPDSIEIGRTLGVAQEWSYSFQLFDQE